MNILRLKSNTFLMAMLISTLLLGAWNPLKVTDPSDPKFDQTQFQFEDYSNEQDFHDVLIKMFPLRTKRSDVENVLIDKLNLNAGFTVGKDGSYFIAYYGDDKELPSHLEALFLRKGLRQSQFEYDKDDLLVGINVHILTGKRPPRFFIGKPVRKGEKL